MSKKIIEWVSRIVWLLGVLFLAICAVCLIIALSKTEIKNAPLDVTTYAPETTYVVYGENAFLIYGWSSSLWRASIYDGLISALCFVVAKFLHYISCKVD